DSLLGFCARKQFVFAIMSEETKQAPAANDLLKNSTLYREFQAEREEILKHKWIESEKAGRDIGFERALTDWIIKHRSKWRKSRQAASQKARRHSFNAAPRGCEGTMSKLQVQSPKSKAQSPQLRQWAACFFSGLWALDFRL